MRLIDRFWSKVRKTRSCWLWTGALSNHRYGHLKVSKKTVYAHRLSWQLHFGKVPARKCVLHQCDRPDCVRPDHLFLGTKLDNTRDMYRKGRNYWPKRAAETSTQRMET